METGDNSLKDAGNSLEPIATSSGDRLLGIGTGKHPNTIDALKPYAFKPGQSGNPSGRPKKIATALDKALKPRKLKAMANGIIDQAIKGDVAAFKEIADRVDGPVARPITGQDGGPLTVEIVTRLIGSK